MHSILRNLLRSTSLPYPNAVVVLAQCVALLTRMVTDHSDSENTITLPRLQKRVPGIAQGHHNEHCDECKIFTDLVVAIQELQGWAQTLRDEMVFHF